MDYFTIQTLNGFFFLVSVIFSFPLSWKMSFCCLRCFCTGWFIWFIHKLWSHVALLIEARLIFFFLAYHCYFSLEIEIFYFLPDTRRFGQITFVFACTTRLNRANTSKVWLRSWISALDMLGNKSNIAYSLYCMTRWLVN